MEAKKVKTVKELRDALREMPSYWDKFSLGLCEQNQIYVTPSDGYVDITSTSKNDHSKSVRYVMDMIDLLKTLPQDAKVRTENKWDSPLDVYYWSCKMMWGEKLSYVAIR